VWTSLAGHYYVHERCSLWSHGVTTKKETSLEEAVHSRGLSGLEGAVISAAWQRCAHCKHFGASVKCKASGRYYHFPCGAASGSFMHKVTLSLIGSTSLSKVASLGKSSWKNHRTYIIYNILTHGQRVSLVRADSKSNA
jgi:hypothetical protein